MDDYLWPNQRLVESTEFYFQLPPVAEFLQLEPVEGHEPAPILPPYQQQPPSLTPPLSPSKPPQQQQPPSQKLVYPEASREQEIKEMSDFIKLIIESRGNRPDGLSSRVRVHEVILIVLLITQGALNGAINFPAGLAGILAFCDQLGRRCSGQSGFFKALDTETMALLWQRIKGNRTGKYETFARAMRVRRGNAATGGYFAAQDSGRCKKKRVYKLGRQSLEEMERLRHTLQEFAQQRMQQDFYA